MCGVEGVWELFISSPQFCYELENAIKKSLNLRNKTKEILSHYNVDEHEQHYAK